MKISEELIWESRKEKDALLKKYTLDEVKKLAYILSNGTCWVRKDSDKEFTGKFFEYYVHEKTELNAYLKIIERLGNKNSARYPIC